jgi:hypothetical protein
MRCSHPERSEGGSPSAVEGLSFIPRFDGLSAWKRVEPSALCFDAFGSAWKRGAPFDAFAGTGCEAGFSLLVHILSGARGKAPSEVEGPSFIPALRRAQRVEGG